MKYVYLAIYLIIFFLIFSHSNFAKAQGLTLDYLDSKATNALDKSLQDHPSRCFRHYSMKSGLKSTQTIGFYTFFEDGVLKEESLFVEYKYLSDVRDGLNNINHMDKKYKGRGCPTSQSVAPESQDYVQPVPQTHSSHGTSA